MKACWNELFALGLAQCSNVMNVGTILSAIIAHLQTSLQEGRGSSVTLRGKPIMPCSLLKLTLLHSSKLVFFLCVCILSPTDKLSPDRVKLVMEHIWRMQEFCNSMIKLTPDSYEYAYLKAIVLFSPGE